jgi:hypothetical protein
MCSHIFVHSDTAQQARYSDVETPSSRSLGRYKEASDSFRLLGDVPGVENSDRLYQEDRHNDDVDVGL